MLATVIAAVFACNPTLFAQCETWQPIGEGVGGVPYAITSYDGDLIAAGAFTSAGGQPANRIARWNGSDWEAMGPGLNDLVS